MICGAVNRASLCDEMATVESPRETLLIPDQIVVLSGPSGSGKTTLVERLLANSPIPLMKCVSATTRPQRPGEVEGEAYYFLAPERFEELRQADAFLEYAEVYQSGYWYGTLMSEVTRARSQQAWAFLEIDVHGALNVTRLFPDAVTIFLKMPSHAELERRLRGRQTESEEVIQRRLATAREELQYADQYQHQVVNDDLDRAVAEIHQILKSHANRQA